MKSCFNAVNCKDVNKINNLFLRKRYGHGGRVHEIKITDTAEITIAGTNPNPEP